MLMKKIMNFGAILLVLFFVKGVCLLSCPKGKYSDITGNSCKWCEDGEYNVKTGAKKCEVCPVGHRCYYVDALPVKCRKGKYQEQVGQRACKWCEDGEYNVITGATKCEICPVGHRCYYVDALPVKCRKGKYQDQVGQRACKWCKDGEYNVETGATKCEICPVGHRCYYVDALPVKCGKGKYQDQVGQRACKWCKDGQYNIRLGATECKSCPAGSKCPYVDAIPLPCRMGEYSPAESLKCLRCPKETFCPIPSISPIMPSKENTLKNDIDNFAELAAESYLNQNDSRLNGLRLIDSDKKIHGFVKYEEGSILVSFRGTVDLKDWLGNVKFFKKDYANCNDCKVHIGFLNAYNSVRMEMLSRISYFSHAHPNSKIIVTGHSLGAAQATLAAADLAKAGYKLDLITFGSPRVGNKQFSEYINKGLKGKNFRVTFQNDIVTVTPPQLFDYWHVGQELHYTDSSTMFKLPQNTDINYNRLSSDDHKIMNYKNLNK